MPEPGQWLFPAHTDRVVYDRAMERLSDLHIYTGSKCNRACDFCIVSGRPDGWYQPITEETLEAALGLVPMDGVIKFYGGEPTVAPDNLLWAMRRLRERGFQGWFTIFSNGVLADRVVRLLEADDRTDVVLNYSILHGEDAEPIPPDSLAKLKAFEAAHPGRITSSHAGVFPFGRGVNFVAEVGHQHITERMNTSMAKKMEIGELDETKVAEAEARNFRLCPRCRPVVGTDGRHHACPFAVESTMPHFDMGATTDSSEEVLARYQRFLDWINDVLEPEAERRQIHPCLVCTHHLNELPQPSRSYRHQEKPFPSTKQLCKKSRGRSRDLRRVPFFLVTNNCIEDG